MVAMQSAMQIVAMQIVAMQIQIVGNSQQLGSVSSLLLLLVWRAEWESSARKRKHWLC